MRVPVTPHFQQYLVLSISEILAILVHMQYYVTVFSFISLMTHCEHKHMFMNVHYLELYQENYWKAFLFLRFSFASAN